MEDVGIVSYGVYIPKYRLNRKTVSEALDWLKPGALLGEKAIANYDEDSLTMAVAAGTGCLKGFDRAAIDGMYLATTTFPYREREGAAIVATALDLRSDIRTGDFTDSLKAGTGALLATCRSYLQQILDRT